MKTTNQFLFTGVNTIPTYNEAGVELFYRITLYRTFLLFYAQNVRYRGEFISEHVDLEVYGALVEQFYLNAKGDQVVVGLLDRGPLSGQQYEVSYLVNNLTRMPLGTIKEISALITQEIATWNKNPWGNPFGKAAENALKEKRRKEGLTPEDEIRNYERGKNALSKYNHESLFLKQGQPKGGLNI